MRRVQGAVLAGIAGAALVGALPGQALADSPSPSPSPPPTAPASGSANPDAATFGVQPASASPKGVLQPDSRPFLYYAAAPGSTITDHVAVLNLAPKPVALTVYTTDALNDTTGGFALKTGDQKPTDAGAWTSIGQDRKVVTVPARTKAAYGTVIVPVTIRIPANASPGDHVAGVVASLVSGSATSGAANVRLDQRVGTRLFIRVAGPLDPKIAIENLHASYSGTPNPAGKGTSTVTFTVANRGNVKLGGRISLRVSGPVGPAAQARLDDMPLLLPGNSVEVTAEVPGVVPAIRDTATVTLTPLRLQGDADPPLPDVVESNTFWAMPWTLLAVLLALLLVGWLLWRRRGRVRPAAPAARDAVPTSVPSP